MAKDKIGSSRDVAGIGPHLRAGAQLVPLRSFGNLKIADGEPDIRGWEVRTVSGREIGKVDELLVDRAAGEIVMLQIDLPGTNRHTLAPIRAAHIDRTRRVVLLDSAELRDEGDIPSLAREGELTDEEVRLFGDRYDRAYGDRGWGADRDYSVPHGTGALRFSRRADDRADARVDERVQERIEERAEERAEARREAEQANLAALAEQDRQRERERLDRERLERERVEREQEERQRTERQLADARRREVAFERERAQEQAAADRNVEQQVRYAGGVEERVVERRPVVVEEVVVRRRTVDPDSPEGREALAKERTRDRADEERDRRP